MINHINDIKHEYLNVDFYLTKSCNKSCHYCTAWTLEMRNLEVDMDFLRQLLDYFKEYKMRINLLGGEPGLVKNLKEVVEEIQKNPNHIVCILSNSLVRRKYPWVLEDPTIFYLEHLALDFYPDRIEKLGNYDFFGSNDKNNYNMVIMTPNFQEYKLNKGVEFLQHKNTIFKVYNSRAPEYGIHEQAPLFDRQICAAFPSVPVIDFEIRKIRHCSKKVINGSRTYDINQENVDKMMNFELFKFESYCDTCTERIHKRPQEQILRILEVME